MPDFDPGRVTLGHTTPSEGTLRKALVGCKTPGEMQDICEANDWSSYLEEAADGYNLQIICLRGVGVPS